MTVFIGTAEDDYIDSLSGSESDIVVIQPGGGHDTVMGFESGQDIVILDGFEFGDAVDLTKFVTYGYEDTTRTFDLSAANGDEPGTQTLKFFNTGDIIGNGDFVLGLDTLSQNPYERGDSIGNPLVVPDPPELPCDLCLPYYFNNQPLYYEPVIL